MKFEDRPTLGTRIVAHEKMFRAGWPRALWKAMAVKVEVRGIYAGYRDLQDGEIEMGAWEEGNSWKQTGRVRCALIIPTERINPIRVSFAGLTLEETDNG